MTEELLTLREAAFKVGRSPGTLRRYIKNGRLPAEKHRGKYGVEYRIRVQDLDHLHWEKSGLPARLGESPALQVELGEVLAKFVPVTVFNELTLKHERILVEFGMLQAQKGRIPPGAGVERSGALEKKEREVRDLRVHFNEDLELIRDHLRQSEKEVEEKESEIILLREKVNQLEQRFLEGPERAMDGRDGAETVRVRQTVDRLRQWLSVCERESEFDRP